MKLTKQTDFAFRSLIYLGSEKDRQRLVKIQAMCDFYGISPNHLSKVVMRLVRLGYVEAVRGKGGGVRLAVEPEQVALVDVIKAFETTLEVVDCRSQPCAILASCRLRGMLGKATHAFLQSLAPYTLADLVTAGGDPIRLIES